MNVVDSSAWLEYVGNTKRAKHFARAIEDTHRLVVPTITLFEVFKKIRSAQDETMALRVVAFMRRGLVVDLDSSIALTAANYSFELKIPMADSIILATARLYRAQLWTQDSDFVGIPDVKYFKK